MSLFLMALLAAPAAAAPTDATSPNIVVEGKKPERKICKTIDAPTGSRIGEQQVCKTKAEWDFEEAAADRNISRENQRMNALKSELLNEQNAFSTKKPH